MTKYITSKDFEPYALQNKVSKDQLKLFLFTVRRSVWFCWHNWVYFRYGKSTRLRRVCSKCYKKQKHNEIITKNKGWWINVEQHYA